MGVLLAVFFTTDLPISPVRPHKGVCDSHVNIFVGVQNDGDSGGETEAKLKENH